MGVLAIIAALLLEQWRPLGDRKTYFAGLAAWADWLERSFNAGEARHGAISWLLAVGVPIGAVATLHAALWWMRPLAGLLVNVAALYLTLGFRQFSHWFTDIQKAVKAGEVDRARELIGDWRGESALHRSREEVVRLAMEEAIAASHRHVFAVILWFIVLPGPSGAILYRLAVFLGRRWGALGDFGRAARTALRVLEWPAVRLSAASFAVVGDFEDAVYCWRTQAAAWSDPDLGIVLAAGGGALGVRLGMPLTEVEGLQARADLGLGEAADAPFLDSTVGLLWRALVFWVAILIALAIARAL